MRFRCVDPHPTGLPVKSFSGNELPARQRCRQPLAEALLRHALLTKHVTVTQPLFHQTQSIVQSRYESIFSKYRVVEHHLRRNVFVVMGFVSYSGHPQYTYTTMVVKQGNPLAHAWRNIEQYDWYSLNSVWPKILIQIAPLIVLEII